MELTTVASQETVTTSRGHFDVFHATVLVDIVLTSAPATVIQLSVLAVDGLTTSATALVSKAFYYYYY